MGMVIEKVNRLIDVKMEAVDSLIVSINSRMRTADSRSQAHTRKQSELEHKTESLAGAVDAVQSNQLENERILRNITLELTRQNPRR